jgi:hypothetical protein
MKRTGWYDPTSVSPPMLWNWYRAWFPNSEAAKRKPGLRMHIAEVTGMVSK